MLFSFSDLWERLRDRWNDTVKPSWKNLLSERQNTLNLFSVIVILELLLCILFLSYANNLAVEATVRADYEAFSATALTDTNKLALQSAMDALTEQLNSMGSKNTAVFVFAAVTWFLTAFFILTKMISSSVELKKFVYGLYIAFGANTKKIRGFIFCQMMTLGLVALLPALAIASLISYGIYGFVSYAAIAPIQVIRVLVSFAVMLIVAIAQVARGVTKKTCVTLLTAADVSDMVKSPKRSARMVCANRPFRMAQIALKRMKSHYLPTVISASLPVCLFFCCMSLALSNEARSTETVNEYTLQYPSGLGITSYRNGLRQALLSIDGITDAVPNAAATADSLNLHMLLTREEANRSDQLVSCHGGIAYMDLRIVSADYYSLKEKQVYPKGSPDGLKGNSFEIDMPKEGQAILITPDLAWGKYPQKFQPEFITDASTIFLSTPSETAKEQPLEARTASDSHEGMSLTLTSVTVNGRYNPEFPYNLLEYRLDEQLLVLNPADYERMTGVKVINNIKNKEPSPIFSLRELGSYATVSTAVLTDGAESVSVPSLYASHVFTAEVADEFTTKKYGLSADVPLPQKAGEVTLIRSWNSYVSESAQLLRVSKTTNLPTPDPEDLVSAQATATDRLQLMVSAYPQYYTEFTVLGTVYSTAIDHDVLLMYEYDLTAATGREGVYTDVGVAIAANIEPSRLCSLLTNLNMEVANPSFAADLPTLTQSGDLWNAITVDNCQYNSVARALATILLLSVPFIWFCPQFNFYSKRKNDLEILCAIGQPRRVILQIMMAEGLQLALMSALASLILCPIFTVATFEFLKFNGFPFAYSHLDPWALVAALIYSAVCAFLATAVNYPILFVKSNGKNKRFDLSNDGKEFI